MAVKFNEFNMDKDNWKNYVDRFNYCLLANSIDEDDLMKANFLAVCGHNLYDLILSLISPKAISSVTYADIKSVLDEHFNPKQNEIVQSYKFHMRCQLPNESVKDYVAGLRKLAIDCNFADLDRTLRDRLVCGILDKNIQKQLLQQTTLTFEQATTLARAVEVADAGVVVMSASVERPGTAAGHSSSPAGDGDEPMEINKIKARSMEPGKDCWRCGKIHGKFCKFRWSRCYECKKIGHIADVCPSTRDKSKSKEHSRLNGVYEDGSCYYMFNRVPPFCIEVKINGRLVNLEVDSGAAFTMLKESTALDIWDGQLPKLSSSKVMLTTWTSSKVALLGETEVDVHFKGTNKKLTVLIAKGEGPNLLGRDWFTELNICINGIYNIQSDNVDIGKELIKFKEVFQPGLGKYTGPVVTIPLKPDAKPRFLKCRPIAFAIKDRVLKEIDRLVTEDVECFGVNPIGILMR